MKAAAYILLLYVGFVIGSLQVLAFPDKQDGLGVLILITIILLLAAITHARGKRTKQGKTVTKSSAKKRNAIKSRLKMVKS